VAKKRHRIQDGNINGEIIVYPSEMAGEDSCAIVSEDLFGEPGFQLILWNLHQSGLHVLSIL
jgi:hypothetical protein